MNPTLFRALRPVLSAGALFLVEIVLLSLWLDGASLPRTGITGLLNLWGAAAVRWFVASAGLAGTICLLAWSREADAALPSAGPPRWRWAVLHLAAMAAVAALLHGVYELHLPGAVSDACTVLALVAGFAAGVSALLAFAPLAIWRRLFAPALRYWPLVLGVGVLACFWGTEAEHLWRPLRDLTFTVVTGILRPVLPGLFADAARATIGTPAFSVEIAAQCSGFQGMGLMMAFGAGWLWLFRRDFRFPQALLMLPAGVAAIWVLNCARIALLILIGAWGAPAVALGGFHSQAGWIAFNGLALGTAVIAHRIPWITRREASPAGATESKPDATSAYLLPFLAILGVGMLSRAVSGDFEWLYATRFLAAAAVLWSFRRQYRALDWRAGWLAPLTGAVVIALWIGLEPHAAAPSPLGAQLAALPPAVRWLWLIGRILGAVVTVPIAEELAFRGFLLRRLVAADFEALPTRRFTWLGLVVSSLAFGLLHGSRWMVGSLSGLLFAAVYLRKGRIGDAVIAHATANAILAAWVLATGAWQLW